MSFASRLREQRIQMNLTQAELAEALGVTKGAVGHYEAGLNSPKAEVLFKVFEVLQCDANYLFQDEMSSLREDTASPEEMEMLVKKFRLLDDDGKEFILSSLSYAVKKKAKTIIFPQRAPSCESHSLENSNTIESHNKVPLKFSEQGGAAGNGVYLGPESFVEYMVEDNELTRRAAFAVPMCGDSMEPKFHNGDFVLVNFESVEPGDIALVTMDGYGYIKKLGEGELLSLNPKYKPIHMTEDLRINGKVLGIFNPDWFG